MRRLAAALAGLLAAGPALADCFEAAGRRYDVAADLLRAIAQVESAGDFGAIGRNKNGTEDLCAMQINSAWLEHLELFGITRSRLLSDPCMCVNAGAWILAGEIAAVGYDWRAVARYHTRRPEAGAAYARRVAEALEHLKRRARVAPRGPERDALRPSAPQPVPWRHFAGRSPAIR